MKLKYLFLLGIPLVANCHAAKSLTVTSGKRSSGDIHFIIENENMKNLNLLIKPEIITDKANANRPGEISRKAGWLALTVPACAEGYKSMNSEFRVSQSQLGNFQYYSITGETNPLTPIGTCYNLERGKCYKIRFTNNAFGTDCISTEIKGEIPHVRGRVKIIPSKTEYPHHLDENASQPERPSEVLNRN